MNHARTESQGQTRLLHTLERLLAIPSADLTVALSHATDLVADALGADKVDAFLYDPERDSMIALGRSNQPLSDLQKRVGLDVLQIANGGRVVEVFRTGTTFLTGKLEEDPEELRGVKEVLRIRSTLGVPIDVGGQRRGVLMIASQKPDYFVPEDVSFAEAIARCVGNIAHRAELVEEIAKNAVEQGRRAVAEELVTVLAHDLRNHLSPITIRLNLLRRRSERDGREQDRRDADLALKAVSRLSSLISEILDVARIDQGVFEMNAELTELVALVEETGSTLATPEHPILVRANEELIVRADPARIRQCLENLLSNAVKHSPSGAPVTVTISPRRDEHGEQAFVEIRDDGPGVPAEILPTIFERFVRGPKREGLGLGLYLAKRIAVMHGGDITVSTEPGRGARFCLRLPCEPNA